MNRLLVWLKAPRPQFFTAAAIPVMLGAAIAAKRTGFFDWSLFWLSLTGGLFAQAGLNLTNDYYDYLTGDDVVNKTPTPFSGGSGLLTKGLLRPKEVFFAGIACFGAAVAIGLYLVYALKGYLLLLIGGIGIFLAFFYTAGPFRIGYTRFGELATGLGFGPIMVLGSYYVQTKQLSWEAFWASVPVCVLIALVLYINEFPDYEADRISGKKNTVVSIGKKKATGYYAFFIFLPYLIVAVGAVLRVFPALSLITLLTFPLAVKAAKIVNEHYDSIKELLPANALTIVIHFSFGALFVLAYLL